jgi:uncharacterized membrane protein
MRLRVAIGLLALAGAGLASYLLYVRYSGTTLACTTGGCETVQSSSYSKLLGVPVALLGLVGYVAIFASSLSRREPARAAGFSVALAGLGFGGYLLYVQLAVIDAICEWCVASDVVMTALAALTLWRLRSAE